MAAALAAEKPLSMTFFSACGRASIAAAATSSASSATIMRPRYGQRNGSSARSGLSVRALGRSEPGFTLVLLSPERGVLIEPESPQVQLPPHAEIAGQAVQRMPESGGPVVLEEEVSDPRKAVAAERRRQQPPRVAGADEREQAQHRA